MIKKVSMIALTAAALLFGQEKAGGNKPAAGADPFERLSFLRGTWEAKAQGRGGVAVTGTYQFRLELDGHILARHSRSSDCQAPSSFDCQHGDLLYVYQEAPGQALRAIYFDSEGHVLHYQVTVPDSNAVIFLSEAGPSAPQFRLSYQLSGGVLSGKFEMQAPGETAWKPYLEWSGKKRDGA